MAEIDLRDISLTFPTPVKGGRNVVFEHFDLAIEKGSFTVLLGPSGCGKSTFLNIINGLLTPTSAEAVLVDGSDVREDGDASRKMAYIFQGPRLLPWKTLRGNVEFGMRGLGVQPRAQWGQLVEKYFAMVGLTEYMDHYPHQVSGGMQQRAAIARAWVNEPEILLMDEPFSHLDEITGAALRRELVDLWSGEKHRRTVVFVTHNITEAVQLASDIVVLTRSPSEVCYRTAVDLPWPRDPSSDETFALERELRKVFAEKAGIRL